MFEKMTRQHSVQSRWVANMVTCYDSGWHVSERKQRRIL